jgi:hypothetical protein
MIINHQKGVVMPKAEWIKAAMAMKAGGASEADIARFFEVTPQRVNVVLNPEAAQRRREAQARYNADKRAEAAYREKEREKDRAAKAEARSTEDGRAAKCAADAKQRKKLKA